MRFAAFALALALVLVIPPLAGGAQSVSPAEAYGRAVVEACNSGDPKNIIATMDAAYSAKARETSPPAQRAVGRIDFCRATGGWTFSGTEAQNANLFDATYAAKNLPQLKAEQHVATDKDGKVTEDRFSVELKFENLPPQTDAQLASTLDKWFDGAARNNVLGGVVLLEHRGQIVLRRAYNAPKYPGTTRQGPATRFPIASMGKMFTAVAVAQLIEAHKLRYDETLAEALPSYTGAGAQQITIAELLSHTAGLGDEFTPAFDAFKGDLTDNDAFIKFFEHDPLIFKPGTSWHYSNAGFVLLGAIVQRASGTSFYTYVQKHIFAPAGMTHTGYDPLGVDRPTDAVAYRHDAIGVRGADGGLTFNDEDFLRPLVRYSEHRVIRGNAAGNAYSTVDDLDRFVRALIGGRLVTPASLKLLFAPHGTSPRIDPDAYGYGFELTNRNGRTIPGHNGGTEYMVAGLRIIQNGDYVLVVYNALGGEVPAMGAPVEYLQALLTEPSGA